MKHKIVRISSRVFIAAAILFLTFRHRFSGSVLEISEAENDLLDQNVKVSILSEKKEILQNITTGLVYTFELPTKEDADSKSLVPKILHFIWMGSSVKQAYLENIVTWRLNNPSYKVLIAIQK